MESGDCYCRIADREVEPLSGSQSLLMAKSGQFRREDSICQGGTWPWDAAIGVKGRVPRLSRRRCHRMSPMPVGSRLMPGPLGRRTEGRVGSNFRMWRRDSWR